MATRPRINADLASREYKSLSRGGKKLYQRGANQVSSNRGWTAPQRHVAGMSFAGKKSAGRAGG